MNKLSWARASLAAIVMSGLLLACGGGSGGSSNPPTATAPAAVTNVAGTVTGFASVVVDGIEYAEASSGSGATTVAKEVDPSNPNTSTTVADLQLGQNVEFAVAAKTLGAGYIRPLVVGPVASAVITALPAGATGGFVALGQTIYVSATTTYAGGYLALADVTAGIGTDVVEVHGTFNADGSISATRVEKEGATAGYAVVGKVAATPAPASGTFAINGLSVTYTTSGATPTKLLPTSASISAGETVTVFAPVADYTAASTTLAATAIRVHGTQALAGQTIIEGGRAHNLAPATGTLASFTLEEFTVDTTSSALKVFSANNALSDIVDGTRVLVQGTVSSSGTLVASTIWVKNTAGALLVGPVKAIDTTAKTLTLRHSTVDLSKIAFTVVTPNASISVGGTNISVGSFVVVTGTPSSSGITASSITLAVVPVDVTPGSFPSVDLPPGWVPGSSAGPGGANISAYGGTVSTAPGAAAAPASFALTDRAGNVTTINVLAATSFAPASATLASVVAGADVLVFGVPTASGAAGSVDATMVVVMP